MTSEHKKVMKRAETRLQKLMQKVSNESGNSFPKPLPRSHAANAFTNRSDGAQQTARHRHIEYAMCFLEQREWRVGDWITVMMKMGWLEAFWESKAMWELRMDWVRTLLATCMSTHWGTKLGLYLALTEH
eukprot:1460081-Pleurochrysis_carterae.AAC.2